MCTQTFYIINFFIIFFIINKIKFINYLCPIQCILSLLGFDSKKVLLIAFTNKPVCFPTNRVLAVALGYFYF